MTLPSTVARVRGRLVDLGQIWQRRGRSTRRAEARTGYLFVLPLIVLLLVFTFFPAIYSFALSLYHYDPFGHAIYFVGLRNYAVVIFAGATPANPSFDFSVLNVLFYAAIVVSVQTFVAFAMAVLFNSRRPIARVTRAIVFVPAATSSIAMSALFYWVFAYQGPANVVLGWAHISPLNWFNDPHFAFYAIMVTNIFSTAPYFMVVYLAGLQAIPTSILEAANLDGVRSLWARTRYFYFPMVRFSTILVVLLGLIGCIQLFDQVFFLTDGGPAGATYVPVIYIFNNAFVNTGTQGVAAAASVVVFIVIMAITVTQRRFLKEVRWAA